ncbi:hypothetical protein SELMODRAFT_100516 [Selaginella moellendorffii]|uniref:Amino acid transporter transmembrane domain-containing protein n=1 Tax=Selaginella moellendorffii TaxID=88036 RepID=D8RSR0_SELML|nr:auxin transporter-like protein 3 isoform X2 [Selaginella moellendorffii]EFJ24904.1 hypothetical protein SELMODRAFT_100516 [Selaginella moellendorffii]|eukprot:XP_002973949.1 auxin transporter-like protein 3 isoform X2 [Selaginella moellendorffii]
MSSTSNASGSAGNQRNSDPENPLLLPSRKGFSARDEIARVFFRGGSSFDAWLTACTAQVAQVLLTLPYSFAQMGMVPGILFQLVYGLLGCWSCYMTTSLYADYVRILDRQNSRRDDHIIQWYEVLGGLLGKGWKMAGLASNCILLLCTATIQLIACGSTVWYINDSFEKRTWTYIFGAGCFLTVFVPTARNYRLWAFVGIFMTTYTAWFMTISAVIHGKVENVEHSGAKSSVQYFTGGTNILYAFGGHAVTLEIMDAMHKPRSFKIVYLCAVLYIFTLTIPSAASVYWRFGDAMLHNPNALAVFPRTRFRDAAVVLMLAHQFIEFGVLALPIFVMWEKLLGVHHSKKHYIVKSLSRIPIVLVIWFIAIMIPFFGPINSVVGALLASVAVYILPCVAFMYARQAPESRKGALEQPPCWLLRSWVPMYCINLGSVLWVAIVGVGFGGWASVSNLMEKISSFGFFARCYQCNSTRH